MKSLSKVAILCIVMLLLTACSQTNITTPPTVKANTWYPIGKIINNDTFEIIVGDRIEQVTFLALDIPNLYSEPFGEEANYFLKTHLTEASEIKLSFDEEIRNDRGQIQAIVELKDGTIINEKLLEAGLAKVLIVEPNIKTENRYKQIEQLAKSNRIGIWTNASETSNEDVPIKDMAYTGISLTVNKHQQTATIMNNTSQSINLSEWKLVNVLGKQTYHFESYILKPREKVHVVAKESSKSAVGNTLYWGMSNIWDTLGTESVELYNNQNELIAVWEE